MKLVQIFGGIFFLIVLHLTVFISGSSIQRSLSDDIRNGISIAGKILGKFSEQKQYFIDLKTDCDFFSC